MEEQRNVQLHRDVVVYHILPHVLAEHTQRAGLGTALSNVLICRAAVTASRSLAFWLPWLVSNRKRFVLERSVPGLSEFVDKAYVLVPEMILKAGGVLAVVKSKRVLRKGVDDWGTMVEGHRVVEGLSAGGRVRRDAPHVRYGRKKTGTLFAAEQNKGEMKFRWGCGSFFEGSIGPVQGTVQTADGQTILLREKEKSKKKEKVHERRVELRVLEAGVEVARRVVPEEWLWRSDPKEWLTKTE